MTGLLPETWDGTTMTNTKPLTPKEKYFKNAWNRVFSSTSGYNLPKELEKRGDISIPDINDIALNRSLSFLCPGEGRSSQWAKGNAKASFANLKAHDLSKVASAADPVFNDADTEVSLALTFSQLNFTGKVTLCQKCANGFAIFNFVLSSGDYSSYNPFKLRTDNARATFLATISQDGGKAPTISVGVPTITVADSDRHIELTGSSLPWLDWAKHLTSAAQNEQHFMSATNEAMQSALEHGNIRAVLQDILNKEIASIWQT